MISPVTDMSRSHQHYYRKGNAKTMLRLDMYHPAGYILRTFDHSIPVTIVPDCSGIQFRLDAIEQLPVRKQHKTKGRITWLK